MHTKTVRGAALLILLLVSVAPSLGAQESKGGLLTPHGGLMFWTLLIFGLLFYLLSTTAFPKILASVEARERALEAAIASANRDREEAARLLAEQRANLEAARGDAQKTIAEARAAAEHVRNDMLEQTRTQQQELLNRAKREIEQEKDRAVAELRKEAIDLAIAGAGKVIEKNLDDESNRKLVEQFLASIPVTS